MSKCDYCEHVEMCGWRKSLEERGCDFFDDGNKWIPVSERLPQDEQKVLVTTRSGKFIDVTTSIYHHASAYWEHYVIAWMPLPEPYTESEDKE